MVNHAIGRRATRRQLHGQAISRLRIIETYVSVVTVLSGGITSVTRSTTYSPGLPVSQRDAAGFKLGVRLGQDRLVVARRVHKALGRSGWRGPCLPVQRQRDSPAARDQVITGQCNRVLPAGPIRAVAAEPAARSGASGWPPAPGRSPHTITLLAPASHRSRSGPAPRPPATGGAPGDGSGAAPAPGRPGPR